MTAGPGEASRLLAGDHEQLDTEWERVVTAEGSTVRLERFRAFRAALLAHIALEEESLFPRLASTSRRGRVLVERLAEEHRRIQDVLERVDQDLRAEGRSFGPLGGELVEELWEHNAREEEEAYPWFDRNLSPEELRELAERLRPGASG